MPPRKRMMDTASDVGSDVGSVYGGDDDDDDERGKQEMAAARKAAKAQKRGRSMFIDDDVEVEGEEDDEDDDEEGDEGDEYVEDDGAEKVTAKQAERENRQYDVERRLEEDAKLQEQVRQRFEGDNAAKYTREAFEEEDEEGGSGAARFQDLPDATRDPRLWLMKCKPNQEKMLCIQLMQKFLDSMHTDKPLQIKSAACTDIKGYIYVEAYKEIHVREATAGLNHLFYRITQVPVNEMTDVMRVRVDAKKKPLQRNSWVRVRRNDEYKDDLAQVVELDNDGTRARVRLIPRLRVYVTRGLDDDDAGARTMRPPAKLFNPEEVESFGGEFSQVRPPPPPHRCSRLYRPLGSPPSDSALGRSCPHPGALALDSPHSAAARPASSPPDDASRPPPRVPSSPRCLPDHAQRPQAF